MMSAMVRRPAKGGVFEGGRPEEQGKEAHRPGGLKRLVRVEAMISERDAQPSGGEEEEKQADLKSIQALGPDVSRRRRERDQKRAGQKQRIPPMNGPRKHSNVTIRDLRQLER